MNKTELLAVIFKELPDDMDLSRKTLEAILRTMFDEITLINPIFTIPSDTLKNHIRLKMSPFKYWIHGTPPLSFVLSQLSYYNKSIHKIASFCNRAIFFRMIIKISKEDY